MHSHDQAEPDPDDAALRSRFGLAPSFDAEIDVGDLGWVGLSPNADHELRLDVTSVVIGRMLGMSMRTARKYCEGVDEHEPRDRIIRELCVSEMAHYDDFDRSIPVRSDGPLGIFAFDMAMIRSRSSIELILVTGRQGFLIEPCLIARSVMEQLAYAIRVFGFDDDEAIFSSRPQALLSKLSIVNPAAGRAYGYLSRLAHYDPKMHYQFIGAEEVTNKLGHSSSTLVQRSWKFKIVSLAWLFFILDLKARVFRHCYGSDQHFQTYGGGTQIVEGFDKFFAGVDIPAVHQVRALF